jgi:hypothetical protein
VPVPWVAVPEIAIIWRLDEHRSPLLLVVNNACPPYKLLGMTLVIQVFVYRHGAARMQTRLLLYLVGRGAGTCPSWTGGCGFSGLARLLLLKK